VKPWVLLNAQTNLAPGRGERIFRRWFSSAALPGTVVAFGCILAAVAFAFLPQKN